MSVRISQPDRLPDGREVQAITLQGARLTARVLTLGAIVQDLRLNGVAHPLVLGFDRVAPYLSAPGRYVGALVGRYANRIGGARFDLDGRRHDVTPNEGANLLHGGPDGIDLHLWTIGELALDQVELFLSLPDGHMGFPGKLDIRAVISVTDDALGFDLSARTDAPTLCNLAHHGYFTLDDAGDIRRHRLMIHAGRYLPVDAALIPTGRIAPVAGTGFDFRAMRPIGDHPYDHNFCLSDMRAALRPVARLQGQSGLSMTVETTEPGLQLYDGRHFDGISGLEGRRYGPHAGVALETQNWPDAPNRPGFPDAVLRPGDDWRAITRYCFAQAAT
ncbi:galactose mutarotase [Paracoccus sp. DMF-8]|uniref:aldose epimerase family protein n=1 Tax=Paracoccus sp. DMF-8 TaxID=3019445 RepID=UPI0023E80288|nr:galactose mutarotase [Paracoccus sp. DMF-8]MDF3606274.1 galactose mutarotase [Paracoccus sp. DMF-8]